VAVEVGFETHGYDTAFWWTAGIFAVGALIGGAQLRRVAGAASTP
jgi:hypothetical protein